MIDVIVPFMNRPEYTKLLIDAFSSASHGAKIRPVLVDNGSLKRSKDLVRNWIDSYPSLPDSAKDHLAVPKVIELVSNKGFAGALNAAIASGPLSEHVIIMHNDCVPFDGWAGEMLGCFTESDEDIGIVIPRTSYANECSPCIMSVRKRFEAIKPCNKDRLTSEEIEAVISSLFPDKKAFLEELASSQFRTTYSPEISSFCMMTRSDLFSKYGKFDEDFLYRGFEDKFWFRPMERDGYICMIANRAFVHHNGNTTTDGPGYCFPDIFKANEDRYKAKCLAMDAKPAPAAKAPV